MAGLSGTPRSDQVHGPTAPVPEDEPEPYPPPLSEDARGEVLVT